MIRLTTTITGYPSGAFFSTLYFDGETQGEADAANAALDGFWNDMGAVISSALDFSVSPEVELVDVATGNITGIFLTAGASGPFGTAGEVLPLAAQGLLRWRTGQFEAGREVRGRLFIPGPVEGQQTDGVPTAAYVSAVNTRAADLITAGAGAGGLVVYSVRHRVRADVVTGSCWDQWAVLRSRRD